MALSFIASIAAGVLGSLLGLGGGIIIVPTLTLLFGIDIRYAIGASIVSVIATSSGAGATYARERVANVRVGMFLELATTVGAVTGAMIAGLVHVRWLYMLFGCLLIGASLTMIRKQEPIQGHPTDGDALADRLQLHSQYTDGATGGSVVYRVCHARMGFAVSVMAGALSGLLGIGGGIIKVPAMTLGMGIPFKAASATSNFMIGVTAAASAGVFFMRGDIDPFIAVPTAGGVVLGALFGTRLMQRIDGGILKIAFSVIMAIVGIEMLMKGFQHS